MKISKRSSQNKKILIIGNGRWAHEYIKELLSFINNKKIYIFINNYNSQKLKNKFKINYLLNLKEIKDKKISHIIICNKTTNHYKIFKLIKAFKVKTLIEKPLTHSATLNKVILKYSKKNDKKFYLSSQHYFSSFFQKVGDIIQKKKLFFKKIEFIWFDKKNEFRNGIKKKHNYAMKFEQDVFYHFYSILNTILKKNHKKILFSNIFYEKKNIVFESKNITFNLFSSRNKIKRIRKINFFDKKNFNFMNINFSSDNFKLTLKNKLIYLKKDKPLKNQLKNFLYSKRNLQNIAIEKNKNLIEQLNKLRK